jgi:hypothetical protein
MLAPGIRVPVVNNDLEPLAPLAGGSFTFVRMLGDRVGHNVSGIVDRDVTFLGMPPGYLRDTDKSGVGYDSQMQLFCSGSNGCHGDRNILGPMEAITGTHHSSDRPINGSSTAKSFRYLKSGNDSGGVTGYEDEDWGKQSSATKHNEYTESIIGFCINCHGAFFEEDPPPTPTGMGSMNIYKIHPVGIALPDRGEFRQYNPEGSSSVAERSWRVYSLDAPVARPDVPEASSNRVVPGRDIVICLSCHIAHGGPHRSSLRWNYENMVAGGGGGGKGCFICHTEKSKILK